MSSDGICIAITHTGVRCTSAATDAAGHCAHHARIARVMALAPKPTSSPRRQGSSTTVVSSPSIPSYDLSSVGTTTPPVAKPTPTPASTYTSILQSPLIAAAAATSRPKSSTSPAPSTSTASSSSSSSTQHSWMLPCESLLAGLNASFVFPQPLGLPSLPGTLFVTNYRLRFEPLNAAVRSPGHLHRLLDDAIHGIPRSCVAKLSYPQSVASSRSKYDAPTQLVIKFKDLRSWTLGGEINNLMMTLNRHVFVDSPLSLFAFVANGKATRQAEDLEVEGHRIFDVQRDFERMGVDLRNSPYRLTEINKNYALCATYPQRLIVPSSMSDNEILSVAEFRSKGRLPICSFVHPRNQASIWRCAQPKRGIFNAQNPTDERYLARIAASNRNQPKIWIADCRPELNARVNNLTGGGTESSGLQHARLSFLNIANIHAMRESIDNVRSLVMTTNPDLDFSWLGRVEETKWLGHVRLVLSAAVRVADAVENQQTSVLVHCSDGWDRTGQLCALSQLMLDPHYRTIVGFMQIVEKEWIQPGHKFQDRVGPGKSENEEQSPIFLQFLDCVWQLVRQHPTYFEFNGKFLEEIADATFSGRYGTFLGNCDRERTTWNLYTRTPSLWTHILLERELYTNPFYRDQSERTLIPPASSLLRNVTLWTEYYFRGSTYLSVPNGNPCPPTWGSVKSTATNPHQDLADSMAAAMLKIQVLEQELSVLRGDTPASPTPAPTLFPPPPAPVATLHVSPPNPTPTLHQAPVFHQAPVASYTPPPAPTPPPVASVPPTPSYTPKPVSSTIVLPPGSWTCAICSKANRSESLKCVVCGRPPPAEAVTTQL